MISAGRRPRARFSWACSRRIFSPASYEFPLALVFTALVAVRSLWTQGLDGPSVLAVGHVAMVVVAFVTNVRLRSKTPLFVVRNFYGACASRVCRLAQGALSARCITAKSSTARNSSTRQKACMPPRTTPKFRRRVALDRCCSGAEARRSCRAWRGHDCGIWQTRRLLPLLRNQPADAENRQQLILLSATIRRRDSTLFMGDARLSMQGETATKFDVLAVDAFSGDAIPVHLLTREAFSLYLRTPQTRWNTRHPHVEHLSGPRTGRAIAGRRRRVSSALDPDQRRQPYAS